MQPWCKDGQGGHSVAARLQRTQAGETETASPATSTETAGWIRKGGTALSVESAEAAGWVVLLVVVRWVKTRGSPLDQVEVPAGSRPADGKWGLSMTGHVRHIGGLLPFFRTECLMRYLLLMIPIARIRVERTKTPFRRRSDEHRPP